MAEFLDKSPEAKKQFLEAKRIYEKENEGESNLSLRKKYNSNISD